MTDSVQLEVTISKQLILDVMRSDADRRRFKDAIGDVIIRLLREIVPSPHRYNNVRPATLHSREMIKNEECPVCMEPIRLFSRIGISNCGHGFHSECMKQIRDHRITTCPVCREDL